MTFEGPAIASIRIYAIPHIAIHQNWIKVKTIKKCAVLFIALLDSIKKNRDSNIFMHRFPQNLQQFAP